MKLVTFPALLIAPVFLAAQYTGTGSVTRGKAITTTENIFNCAGGRRAGLGSISSSDGKNWIVPAKTNFSDNQFPFSADLYNSCNGNTYANATEALGDLNDSDVVTIEPDGEIITAFIFADNYFELYINGIPAGKDRVPFTPFNSSIVRFRVNRPFTIAMLLVDWEENLGVGSELNGAYACHPGDGGVVAVFKNANNETLAITNQKWKAQTFYTSPVRDLSCPAESGNVRLSGNCSTENAQECSDDYALHWVIPENATGRFFDDQDWPFAKEYPNDIIGINNKPAYTNFTEIFDDPDRDAAFIWSSNVVLDNTVIVRYTLPSATSTEIQPENPSKIIIYPNPATNEIRIAGVDDLSVANLRKVTICDIFGQEMQVLHSPDRGHIILNSMVPGLYFVRMYTEDRIYTRPVIIQ